MQKIQGWVENGNTKVSVSGLLSTTLTQKSFPLATVTVYETGTVTVARIYSDSVGTPLGNPFTADAAGIWGFFAPNGSYDVVFSGTGVSAPFTLNSLWVFDENSIFVDVTSGPFFAVGDGTTDNAAAIAAAWAVVTARKGILFFPPGTYLTTGSIAPVTGCIIQGSGLESTIIHYVGTAYWLDLPATVKVDHFTWRDMEVLCGPSAIGAIEVGRTSANYDGAIFRVGWSLQNLYFFGPGASTPGTIGMSVTQLINHAVSNLLVLDFESSAIIDRCGNGTWTRCRWQAFTFGPLISIKAGSGTAANGSSQDVFINPEFLGPTFGSGDTVTVQTQFITFINALYEPQIGGSSLAALHISTHDGVSADSANFLDINGLFSLFAPGTAATILFDSGYSNPKFYGTVAPIPGFPPVTFGTPYAFTESSAKFTDISLELSKLVLAADPDGLKAHIFAPSHTGFNQYRNQTIQMDQTGMFRIIGTASTVVPTADKAWQTFYQLSGDQAITTVVDSATGIHKPWLVQPSAFVISPNEAGNKFIVDANNTTVDNDLVISQRGYTTVATIVTGATPAVSGTNVLRTNNGGPTTVTNLTGGIANQIVTILFGDANTTVQNNGNIVLNGSVDFVATLFSSISLMRDQSTGLWIELGRSAH